MDRKVQANRKNVNNLFSDGSDDDDDNGREVAGTDTDDYLSDTDVTVLQLGDRVHSSG
jgi:hypothetical protein